MHPVLPSIPNFLTYSRYLRDTWTYSFYNPYNPFIGPVNIPTEYKSVQQQTLKVSPKIPNNKCVKCYNTPQCLQCENKQLKNDNLQLTQQLGKLLMIQPEEFDLKYYHKMDIKKHFKRQSTPFKEFEYKSKLTNASFFTITFDPSKFGTQPFEDERKEYILHALTKSIKTEYFTEICGCFEYHKNGIVHAHFIVITAFRQQLKDCLIPYFTNNKRNLKCIDAGPAKYPQAMDYLTKESTDYFYHHYINRGPELETALFLNEKLRDSEGISEKNNQVYHDTPFMSSNPLDYGLN